MKVIPKLQQGNTIESDNTKVVRPEIHEPIKAKPRQYSIVDLGGEPSNDTRSAAERNRDYWHPIKGAKARFRASMSNETNPLVGIERTILPSAAGAALVTTPAAVIVGALGNMTVDKLTGGWGNWLEDKTGIPSEIGVYTNPGAWYGGAKGYKIGKDKLITKSIKGDADLAWNPINKNHWIFNKEARTPSNIAMATANRITPFLSKVEKLPLKVAAYKAAKRTNGNASVSLQDIKTMPADYTGKNPIGKIIGKEAEPVMRMGDKEFMTFRQPGTDYIGPIDDVAGHLVKFQMNKGKLRQTSQDMWKFNPADYAKRWNDSPNTANQVRLTKQAALMDKVGRPFILQQSNPIWIEGKSVRNPELVTMAHGGRFDFKKSPLLKKQEEINGKRDMRKKFIKSSRPTYKKRIKKAQQGMKFVSYNPVSNPTIDYTDITNPINPFSEYNYNTTYDKPEALVVPVRDTNETDVVANNPTVEPVINKPVASKVTYTPKSYKGLAAFNKAYDEVEASNPEAKKYRQFLTKMAEQESGFNSAIQNRAGAPAYGYFQFMQDDKKYNNIRQYADTDIETFRNNPKLQIEAAIKLAKSFEKGFSKEDLELANKNGYSTWGLLGGAWLAGNGGVRKFLRGQGNPSDRHWSKEGKGTDVATRIKAFNFKEGGMIVKYQNPPHGIARRDATYVAPKMYAPRPYKTKEEEIIEQNRNSEMISIPAHSTIGMVDSKLQVIDTPARQITNVGAGYLSGTDPVGEFVVGNVVAGKPLMWLGKGVKYGTARVFKKGAKPKVDAYYPSKVYKRTVDDVNRDYLNFIEYIDNPETMQKLADIDKELGTQYVKAVTDFKEAAKQGKLRVKSPKPGTLDIQGYPIRNPQTLTHPDIMKNPSYDYIDIDILADFPPNSVGHEFKHAIENYQAALSGIKGSVDDALFANPRLQALMKDNIVSEDEFVASMVKRYPKNDIKEIRKVYKYLTDPGEFNAQLHPLIELEQRAGKSGLPNFKDADAVNQVIKQGRASGHGGSHLDILFNNLLKPDKREEFVKQFNKYGWSLAAPAIINNRE